MLNPNSMMKLAAVLGGMILAASASQAQVSIRDEGIFFTAIGSTGTPDEDSVALLNASRALVVPKQSGTLSLRYNVAPSAELAAAQGTVHLVGNLRDPGIGAKVVLSLVEVDVGDGESSVGATQRAVLSMQSSDLEAAAGASNQCISDEDGFRFDFENKAYYIEARLVWDASVNPLPPQLRAIRIGIFREDHCR